MEPGSLLAVTALKFQLQIQASAPGLWSHVHSASQEPQFSLQCYIKGQVFPLWLPLIPAQFRKPRKERRSSKPDKNWWAFDALLSNPSGVPGYGAAKLQGALVWVSPKESAPDSTEEPPSPNLFNSGRKSKQHRQQPSQWPALMYQFSQCRWRIHRQPSLRSPSQHLICYFWLAGSPGTCVWACDIAAEGKGQRLLSA